MSNVEKLGNRISIPLRQDKDGYLGRECPVETCLGYFKITPGTGLKGLKGPAPCHCPYCGHSGAHNTFFTQEQIEYAKSVAIRRITDAVHQDLKSALEFERKPQGAFGIGFSIKVTSSAPHPIRYYREKQLETEVVRDKCALRFELNKTKDPPRRDKLLEMFDRIAPEIMDASSFLLDVEGAGLGQAYWNDGSGNFDKMLKRLSELDDKNKGKRNRDKEELKRNQLRDISIAETAIKNGAILVSDDINLQKVVSESGGRVVGHLEFVSSTSPVAK